MDDTDPLVTVMKVEKAPQETYADIGGLDNQIQEIKVFILLTLSDAERAGNHLQSWCCARTQQASAALLNAFELLAFVFLKMDNLISLEGGNQKL